MPAFVRRLEYWIGGAVLLGGLLVVCLEVAGRVLAGSSFLWSEELSRYLLVWTTYFGAAAATVSRGHIRVHFLLHLLPRVAERAAECLAILICLSFSLTLVWAGWQLVEDTWRLGMMSADSNLLVPIWVWQSIVPIGFALMSIRLTSQLIAVLRGQELSDLGDTGEQTL